MKNILITILIGAFSIAIWPVFLVAALCFELGDLTREMCRYIWGGRL